MTIHHWQHRKTPQNNFYSFYYHDVLRFTEVHYAECHSTGCTYAEHLNAEVYRAECCYAEQS